MLDRLIMMGVQNVDERYEPGMSTRGRSVPTSLEMRHASSIGSWLLSQIDVLEKEVGEGIERVDALIDPFLQVTQERAERKEMEEAFKKQASNVDVVLCQNQELAVSRTRDLVDQIKQITIEICDIKERKKTKIDSSKEVNTINVRNHTLSGPLQEGHEEHDESDVHYEDSKQTVHQSPHSTNNRRRYVPTQYPTPIGPTSLPPLPPELHPSSPSNESPVKLASSTTPWSKKPNDPASPGNEGDNAGGVVDLLCTTNGTTSGGVNDVVPCAD